MISVYVTAVLVLTVITVGGVRGAISFEDKRLGRKLTNLLDDTRTSHFRAVSKVDEDVEAYGDKLIQTILQLPCITNCSDFDPEWVESRQKIAHYLETLEGIDDVKGITPNTKANMVAVVGVVMSYYRDNKNTFKSSLIKQATVIAANKRGDEQLINVLKIFPTLLGSALEKTEGADYQLGDEIIGHHSPVRAPEEQLDYFREENALHFFHDAWHIHSSGNHPQNRHQNRFYNTHRQLLLRYQIERHVLGLAEIEPLDSEAQQGSFLSYYNIDINKGVWSRRFSSAKEICSLPEYARNDLRRLRRDLDRLAEVEDISLERYVETVEGNYHNAGHTLISSACSSVNNGNRHIMNEATASARDPLFYRWHLEVEHKIVNFLSKKTPYSAEDLAPAPGIHISSVEVHDKCGKTDELATFWELYKMRRNSYYRVNHEEFSIIIRFRNTRRSRDRVIVRIFLGLEEFINSGERIIELDKFTHQLSGSAQETITRSENQSAYTKRTTNPSECAWPQHMFIPRGSETQPTKFRIIAMIHGLQDQRTNEGLTPELSNVMCGVNDHNIVVDAREYAFPFNRKWAGLTYRDVLNNRNRDFGQVSSTIGIHFKGSDYPGKQCQLNTQRPTIATTTTAPTTPRPTTAAPTTPRPTTPAPTTPRPTPARRPTQGKRVVDLGRESCYDRVCFRVSQTAVSWYTAARLCREHRMQLTNYIPRHLAGKERRRSFYILFWLNRRHGNYCRATDGYGKIWNFCSRDNHRQRGLGHFEMRAVCLRVKPSRRRRGRHHFFG